MSDSELSRRKFYMHSAHTTIGVSAGLAGLRACDLTDFGFTEQAHRPLRVCLVCGRPANGSEDSLSALEEHLRKHSVECRRAFRKANDDLPELENLEDADCLLLLARRMTIDGEQLERIRGYCRRGGAVVGVRLTGSAFRNWPSMEKDVLGGECQGRFSNHTTEVRIVEAARDHPVLAGFQPFVSRGSLSMYARLPDDVTVLLTGGFLGHSQPVAWTRPSRGGRVFCTSLGHADDFRQPIFLRLLTNAVFWTCNRWP